MGASASHPTQDRPPSRALHVLRVIPGSPAALAGIQVFFDFVVGIEGRSHTSDAIDAQNLEEIVESHEGETLHLIIWSSKSNSSRVVPVIPSREWALQGTSESHQNGNSNTRPSLLGLSMRVCEPEFALDHVWHILEILEGSPAESAGLVPYGDWIVGWSGGILSKESDFYEVVESHVEKPLRVYVYSYDFDTLREVVLVPNRMWGGEGLLGCGVGYGLLHRIPRVRSDLDNIPFEHNNRINGGNEEMKEEQLFVPADVYPEYDASSHVNGHQAHQNGDHDHDHDHHDQHLHPEDHGHHHHPHNGHSHNGHSHGHFHDEVTPTMDKRSHSPLPAPRPVVASGSASIPTILNSPPSVTPPTSASRLVRNSGSGFARHSPRNSVEFLRRSSTPDATGSNRTSTPDILKRSVTPRLDDGLKRLGIGDGNFQARFIANVAERRTSLAGLNGPPTPTLKAPHSFPQRRDTISDDDGDDEQTEEGSDGDTRGGSITSVD